MENTALLSDDSSRYTYSSGELADIDESGVVSKLVVSRGRTLCLLLAAISSLLVVSLLGFHFISHHHYFKMRPGSDPYVGGPSDDVMLCRTTCSDPCSSYEVRGRVCSGYMIWN